jgi:amidase
MTDVTDAVATWPAVRLAAALRAGEFTTSDLLELYLDRIARLDGPVHAIVTLDPARARADAAAADDAHRRGDMIGPLHGLPITIKDAIEVGGMRSTGGATELAEHVPLEDAPAVARLRDAGAIVFGKTNLPRWSADMQSFNELFGTTNNPWALDRTPGGSSGGAAAAVAAGFTSFELGTDIGGSVRVPSHNCGVYGLKPSYGLVPQRGYLDHVGGGTTDADINVFGPIARSADDLDILLSVLAGPDPERAPAWRVELPEPLFTSLDECRVGLWLDDAACPIEREYAGLLLAAADRLTDAGAKLDESHPAVDFAEQVDVFVGLIGPAVSPSMPDDVADQFGGMHRAWLRTQEARVRLARRWAEWFERYDVLLCPVNVSAAICHQQEGTFMDRTDEIDGVTRSHVEYGSWPGLIGVVGLPSAVSPAGRTAEGLPVGVQIVAPSLHDRAAVRFAQLATGVIGEYAPPPGF